MEDIEAISWTKTDPEDLWIYDKLIVSKRLGYNCGPTGVYVPHPGTYIIRPCVNIPGMGRGAKIRKLHKHTHHLPYGHFWCELFQGSHLSVDYRNGEQILAVEGFRKEKELWRFSKWQKIDAIIPMPSIFLPLIKKYEYINIEYVDGKAIEIHLRHNPDFVHGNSVAYPVWADQELTTDEYYPDVDFSKLKYIKSPDFKRIGFYID